MKTPTIFRSPQSPHDETSPAAGDRASAFHRGRLPLACSLAVCLLLSACGQYSPFRTDVPEDKKDLNGRAIRQLSETQPPGDSFAFAVLGDNKDGLDVLARCVEGINEDPEIRFVLHTGDLTEDGLLGQFLRTEEVLGELQVPYMVVVGNHERQGNGQTIFRSMYGDEDQAFTFGRALFVLFDNNGAELDLQWLDRKLSAKEQARPTAVGSKLTKPELLRFVVAHKPPFDPTPAGDHAMEVGAEEYHGLMVKHDVSLSIHGHIHSYWHGTHRGIRYLISGGAGAELVGSSKYHFSKLRVDGDELSVEQVVVAD